MGRKLAIGLVIIVVIGAGLHLSGGRVHLKLGEHHAGIGKHIGHHGKRSDKARLISVSGSGVVYAAPDVFTLSIGVESFHADADAALDDNNTRMARVIKGLRELGLSENEVRTTGFQVAKIYLEEEHVGVIEPFSRDGFVGYAAENDIFIRSHQLSLVEPVIGSVVGWGATSVLSLGFSIEDETEYLLQATALAVEDAQAKAQQLVEAAGAELGEIVVIAKNDNRYSRSSSAAPDISAILGEDAPLFLTVESVNAGVTVTFGIK